MPERLGSHPEHRKDEEDETRMKRRGFLGILAGATVVVGLSKIAKGSHVEQQPGDPEISPEEKEVKIVNASKLPEVQARPKSYEMEDLKGEVFEDLFSYYTGIRGEVVADSYDIDFNLQLERMWKEKNRVSRGNFEVDETGTRLRREYVEGEKDTMSLEDYTAMADKAIRDVKNNLQMKEKELAKLKHLDPKQAKLVNEIYSSITGKDLLAYCMTEIMPSQDGEKNKKVLNFLLLNAGRQYVESIPALHDKKVSFGPYQFTDYVVYDPKKGKKGGASEINELLPKNIQIPKNVSDLRGQEHHKAAFLFMVENISNLVKDLKLHELEALKAGYLNKQNIVGFIATAHHNPHHAMESAKKWLSAKLPGAFKSFCHHELKTYAIKTEENLKALTGKTYFAKAN